MKNNKYTTHWDNSEKEVANTIGEKGMGGKHPHWVKGEASLRREIKWT